MSQIESVAQDAQSSDNNPPPSPMNPTINIITHPEIEFRPLFSSPGRADAKLPHKTLVDLLEVFPEHITWKEGLDRGGLLEYFQDRKEKTSNEGCRLRLFFVDDLDADAGPIHPNSKHGSNSTASWFRHKFGVSPIFLQCINFPRNWVTIGSASFLRRSANGDNLALDGLYRYPPDPVVPGTPHDQRPPVHVWFSHDLVKGSSTYLIHKCPPTTKRWILLCANGPNFRSLLRPLAVDVFLSEDCVQRWAEWVAETRIDLLNYERPLPDDLDHVVTAKSVEDLYQLSQLFQILRDLIADVQDKLDFVVTLMEKRESKARSPDLEDTTVAESLQFVRSKNEALMRWVINYAERTQVQINRFFNHAAHKDSAVNVSISELTSKIAVSTQKDSSAMITMAAVTMIFLPGSFIAALFSTVFFDTATDPTGKVTLSVHPQWWIFFAVTVPLTIFVFLTWIVWWRIRDRMAMRELPTGTARQIRLEKIDIHSRRTSEPHNSEKSFFLYPTLVNSSTVVTPPQSALAYRVD